MSTLVFLEHHEGAFAKNALGVLGKAASLGGDVHGVVIGSGVRGIAAGAGKYGASKVWSADDAALGAPLPSRASTCSRSSSATTATTPCCSGRACSPRTSRPPSPRGSTPG